MRLLGDGRTGILNTYYCDLYRIYDVASVQPRIERVHSIQGSRSEGCAVTAVIGNHLIVPVADANAVVVINVSDPAHPFEVSRLTTDTSFFPHWIAADPRSDRVVINSADGGEPRILIAQLDRATGRLSWDARFGDAGGGRPGIRIDTTKWQHGIVTHPMAHAAVFGIER